MEPTDWIGRVETREDAMEPWAAQAMLATLDLSRRPLGPGDPLPPFWHWLYFREAAARSALGPDGHPAVGGFMPKVPQPRRMWAGGRLEFHGPLPLGAPATRRSEIADVQTREGRSGSLTFVTVRHEIGRAKGLSATEEQDIVYREDAKGPSREPPRAPEDFTQRRGWRCDSTVLFRYSALTFNGHRIHYDLRHAREVEGYPGLVVHGPLLATLLLELAAEMMPGPLRRFSFRAVAPVFCDEAFECLGKPAGDGIELWVRGANGRLAMTAQAE
ncbi:MAG: MaoC family dehydratase N-terminal domain-containing protein [Pseudomonadota bacterium]